MLITVFSMNSKHQIGFVELSLPFPVIKLLGGGCLYIMGVFEWNKIMKLVFFFFFFCFTLDQQICTTDLQK